MRGEEILERRKRMKRRRSKLVAVWEGDLHERSIRAMKLRVGNAVHEYDEDPMDDQGPQFDGIPRTSIT